MFRDNAKEKPSTQTVYALNFSAWKRSSVRLCFPEHRVRFISSMDEVPERAWLAVWGMLPFSEPPPLHVKIMRIEDGFLRSVGLGADLICPLSWVVDGQGIYYDASHPSDLEVLLSTWNFESELVLRAAALRERIVSANLTKYNVGKNDWRLSTTSKRIILVPGQVESDASLAFGGSGIRHNMALLKAVREDNSSAYVIYKPHPDVVARLRLAGEDEHLALHWCDEIVVDASISLLLDCVDEVHVMTSLTGFEALLRNKSVTCYNQPFFSGWGLTKDMLPLARRTRLLKLDELVACVLILYPRYFNRNSNAQMTAEQAVDQLIEWKLQIGNDTPWWRNIFRVVLRQLVGTR